jgi:hypothetical protein
VHSTSPPSEKRAGRRRVTAVELLIIVQAMARLMCDVDMAEQAELWRLEGGGSPREPTLLTASAWPPSSPSKASSMRMLPQSARSSMRISRKHLMKGASLQPKPEKPSCEMSATADDHASGIDGAAESTQHVCGRGERRGSARGATRSERHV